MSCVLRAQLDPYRRALELQRLAERILEITLVVCRHPLRLTAMHHDHRGVAPALMRVTQPHLTPTNERRRVRLQRIGQHLVQPRSRQLGARILVRQ
jgi:hypothetical protein